MKILFAAPDRDLLMSYRQILSCSGHEVTAVFDGTQVLTHLANERPDLALLDQSLPRADLPLIFGLLRERGIPVILLTARPVDFAMLQQAPPAVSHLAFPFSPQDLRARIEEMVQNGAQTRTFSAGGASVTLTGFLLAGTVWLTNEEINTLCAVANGAPLDSPRAGLYVDSLNARLQAVCPAMRIRYIKEKGYRLVAAHE